LAAFAAPVFAATNPFMYFIMNDAAAAILFMGRYAGPE
jgi:serine protease inhibitor